MSQDFIKIWTVKFGEPPVIRQIHQGFICQQFVLTVFGSLLEKCLWHFFKLMASIVVWMEGWKCTHVCSKKQLDK